MKPAHTLLAGISSLALALMLSACTSPQERAAEHLRRADALLAQGDDSKAAIEYRNAIQSNKNLAQAYYGLAAIDEKKGAWQEMYGYLNKTIELDPKNIEARIKLGTLMVVSGRLDDALQISNKLMAEHKTNPKVLAFRATVMLKRNDSKAAINFANQAIAIQPATTEAWAVLASERLAAGDQAGAVAFLDKGLGHDPKNLALLFMKIRALEQLGQLAQAGQVLDQAIAYYPGDLSLLQAKMAFQVRHGMTAQAETTLHDMMLRNPDNMQLKLEWISWLNQYHGAQSAKQALNQMIQAQPDNSQLQFALYDLDYELHDLTNARAVLDNIVAHPATPQDGYKAQAMLATLDTIQGRTQEARKRIEEVLAADKTNVQALIIRAGLEIGARQYDQAISDLRTATHYSPNASQAWFLLGSVYSQTGKPDLAMQDYLQAVKTSNNDPRYSVPYAGWLMQRHQLQPAEQVLLDTLKQQPDQVAALTLLAQVQIAQSDWTAAAATADHLTKISGTAPTAEQIQAEIQARQGNFTAALAILNRAFAQFPDNVRLVSAIFNTHLMTGKPKDALDFITSLLAKHPDSAFIHLLQGEAYAALNDTPHAIEAWQSSIAEAPRSPLAYQRLADLYLVQKQYDLAQQTAQNGLKAVPNDFMLRLIEAEIHDARHETDQAIAIYEQLLQEKPDSDVVINNLASALDLRSDAASLNRAYTLAQSLQGSTLPYFKDTYGWASYKVGKLVDAASYVGSAASAMPDEALFQYHLGMIALASGNRSDARNALTLAAKLSNTDPALHAQVLQAQQTLAKPD